MIYISHRGNLNGPDPKNENTLKSIEECINKGFQVEVDVWFENNYFYLGHDSPNIKLNSELFKNDNIWFHLKNTNAMQEINKYSPKNFFWHENDICTLTSSGKIWLFPKNYINSPKAIFVLPELSKNKMEFNKYKCFGICTDFVNFYYNNLN